MVFVRVSETYDLSTKVGKMGFVGIHTPHSRLPLRMWRGLFMQYRKVRYSSCDVALACASMLPADPLQIGVEAGAIAPQDMFNPILYKAVSNDSMNNIQKWLQGQASKTATSPNFELGSVVDVNDVALGGDTVSQEQIYYALLSNSDGWRKAMPQAGLAMNNLRPLVYQVVDNYGIQSDSDSSSIPQSVDEYGDRGGTPSILVPPSAGSSSSPVSITPIKLRGRSMPMPAVDTTIFASASDRTSSGGLLTDLMTAAGNADTPTLTEQVLDIPPAYVGLIVLPPAKLNQLYYRLKVTWTLEFSGLRSLGEIMDWSALANLGSLAYGTDYALQSASMTSLESMVDAEGADLTKIMEGS